MAQEKEATRRARFHGRRGIAPLHHIHDFASPRVGAPQRPVTGRKEFGDYWAANRRWPKPPPVPTPQPTAAPPPIRRLSFPSPRPVSGASPVTSAPPVVRSIPPPLAGTAKAETKKRVEVQTPTLKGTRHGTPTRQPLAGARDRAFETRRGKTERHLASVPRPHRATVSPDAVRTIALIRNRHTVRQSHRRRDDFRSAEGAGKTNKFV